jgi:tetratricopeptide (TPR) repeat protein
LLAIQSSVAQQVATTISVPYGPILGREGQRSASAAPSDLDSYQCVLRFYHYTYFFDAQGQPELVDCFERAVIAEPGYADAWAGLAQTYLNAYRFSLPAGASDALDRAREATRRALDIDGRNRLATLALTRIRFFEGDATGIEAAAERALGVGPNNPDVLAFVGLVMLATDQADRGLPLLAKALELSWHPPGWFFLGYVFHFVRVGDYEAALSWALRVDSPDWILTPLLVAATAALAGDIELAERSAARLRDFYPTVELTVRADLELWHLDDVLMERLLAGLRGAGIEVP